MLNLDELKDILKTRIDIYKGECYCYHSDEDCYDEEDWNENITEKCEANSYRNGASKLVLFYDDIPDWVVKIPYFGDYFENEERYADYEGAAKYLPIDSDNDYCEGEVYLCQEAIDAGVGDMFAKTYFLDYFNNVPVYVSEAIEEIACEGDVEYSNPHSAAQAQKIKEFYSYELESAGFYSETTLRYFVDQYGEDKVGRLIQFIIEHEIDDLHDANVGFDKNGKIKIIDCSGFHY